MTDQDKSRATLLKENEILRKRVAELESAMLNGSKPQPSSGELSGFFEILAENAPVGISIVQGTSFVYVNPALAGMVGRSPEDFRDIDFWSLVHPDDRAMIRERGMARQAGKDIPTSYEIRFLKGTAETRYAEFHGTTIEYNGKPATLGIVQDVTNQRAAEWELAQSRETYRTLIENSEDSIYTMDEDGVFLFMNEAAARVLGCAPDDLIGKTQWDIFPKEIADRQMNSVRGVFQTGKIERFERKTNFGGQEHIFFTSLLPIFDSSGKVETVMGISREVSELLETRSALEESRQKYVNLIENLPVGIFQATPEGKVVTGNPALAAMYGCETVEDYLTLPARESFVNPSERDEIIRLATENGQVQNFEVQMKRRDGSYFWISLSGRIEYDKRGRPVLFDGIEVDITKHRQAEEALRKTGDTMRALLNAPDSPLFLIDTDGYLLTLNEVVAQALGHDIEDLIGTKVHDYLSDELARSRREGELEVIRTGKPLRLEDENNGRLLANRLYPVIGADGKVEAIAVSSVDITEREEAERALRASEEMFRTLAETSPVGVMIYQGNKLEYANRALCQLVDLEPTDFGKVDFWKFVHPDYVDLVRQRGLARQRGEKVPQSYELRFTGRGNKDRWGLIYGSPMQYQGKLASMVLIIDITERKEMEQALVKSEEKYRNLFENSQVGMFRSSLLRDEILAVNQRMVDIWGCEIGNISEFNPSQIWNDPSERDRFLEQLKEHGVVSEFEATFQTHSGELQYALVSAKAYPELGFFEGSAVDITDRKRIEQALEDSERSYRTLAEAAPVGIYIFQDDHIVYANRKAYTIAGLDTDKDDPATLMTYLHPDDRELIQTSAESILLGKEVPDTFEIRVITSSGKTGWIILKAEATLYKGRPAAMGVAVDITERKEMEQALQSSQAQLASIFDATDDFILLCDQDAKPIYFNAAYARVMKELAGVDMKPGFQPYTMLPDPEERARWEGYHRRVLGGESFTVEHSQPVADGRTRYFVSSFYPIMTDDGRVAGFTEFTHEITDLKRADEALRKNEELFRGILSSLHETMILMYDREGTYLEAWMGSDLEERYGITGNSMIGKSLYDFLPPEMAPRALKTIENIFSTGESIREVYSILLPTGEFWHDISLSPIKGDSGETIAVVGFIRDITEHTKAKETLRESEEKYRGIFNESVVAICLFDTEKKFIDVNQSAVNLLGYSREELLSLSIIDVDADPAAVEPAREQLLSGGRLVNYEHRLVRKDGQVITVLNNSRPLINAGGEVVGVQSTIIDITDRKQVAEILRKREQFNRAVIENSPLGISVRNQYGKLLSVNQAWRDIWEIPEEKIREYMAANPVELKFDHKDSYLGEWQAEVEKVYREGGMVHVPEICVNDHRSGETRWISHTFYAIHNESGQVDRVVILTNDITNRKRAEEDLIDSKERLRSTIESMNDQVFLLDDKGVFIHYYQPMSNPELFAPPEQFLGKSVEEIMPPDVATRTMAAIESLRNNSTPRQFDYSLEIQGSLRWYSIVLSRRMDADHSFVGVTGVVRDITARMAAAEALKESEEKFRLIAEQSFDAIFLHDREGRIVYVSNAIARVMGYDPADLIGHYPTEIVVPASRPVVENAMTNLAQGKPAGPMEITGLSPGGRRRDLEVTAAPITKKGELSGFQAVVRDITARKRAEKLLARAYDTQSTQLRQVAGGLAHDIYNDLFPVTASLHKLRQRMKASDHPDCERNLKLIGLMDSAVQRAIALTESVNLYSKLDRVAIDEGINLHAVVDNMLEQNRDRIAELQVIINVDIPANLCLKCPKLQGFYLFNNLMINSLDALAHVDRRELSISAELMNNQIRILFSDTGPGIPTDILKRIFDPFFSTKPRTGTGLGLAIVKRIVDLCRGEITVESSLDKGTTFTILITGDVGTS